MPTRILHAATRAAYSAAASQVEQCEAVRNAFTGNVTLRIEGAGGQHLRTMTLAPFTVNTATPRGIVCGAVLADTAVAPAAPGAAGIAPVRWEFRDGSTPIFDSDDIVQGPIRTLCSPRFGSVVFTANPLLPVLWEVPSGAITNVSLNNRDSVNPRNDPLLNPNHPNQPPWEFPGSIGWSSDQLSEFCGAVFCKDWGPAGRYAMWGAPGHSTNLEFPGWVVFDVSTRRWMIPDAPPPVSYTTQAQWGSGLPPSTQADRTWGEWTGGSTDWPVGFRRPGYNPPFGSHTRNNFVYLPASAAGNTSGEIVVAWHGTLGASGTGVPCQHIYNCDTGLWRRTQNLRPGHGSSVGGVAYHPGQDVVVGFSIESSGTTTVLDYLDMTTETWVRRSSTNGLPVNIDSTNIVCGDLFVYVGNGASQTMRAARVSQVKAGGSWSWSNITVSATSWPIKSGGSLPNTLSCQWARCPVNGAWYAVDRNGGSLTLWKLQKPAGVADGDTAGLLAGTWNVTTETLTGAGLEPAQYDYSRLQWCDSITAFLWTGDLHTSNVQAIRPVGV